MRIGIVGHCYLGHTDAEAFITQNCQLLLQKLLTNPPKQVALSALAEGADTIFAEVAISLGIPLEIVCPFETYENDFLTSSSKQRYQELKQASRKETKLPFLFRSDDAYVASMKWIISESDIMVAVWDGCPARGVGGTGDAVKERILTGRPWVHLNNVALSVTVYI